MDNTQEKYRASLTSLLSNLMSKMLKKLNVKNAIQIECLKCYFSEIKKSNLSSPGIFCVEI